MTILTAKDIEYYAYERPILDITSLEIEHGKVISIIGPNGAGKSTLLKVLSLLLQPHKGNIFYKGTKVTMSNSLGIRRKMSVVFQEPLLLDGTVYWNMEIGLKIRRINETKRARRIEDWLERLNITHLKNQHVSTLSGGEAQRVNLARALVLEPEILFLDEPFSFLDQPTKEGLIVDLYKILKANKVTTFFVTHDFREMLYLSDYACVMLDGKIVQKASPLDILNKPIDIRVAKFVGIENIFNGRISLIEGDKYYVTLENGNEILAYGNYGYKVGEKTNIIIRSENISMVKTDYASPNLYEGTVIEVYPTEYGWKCRVAVCNETFIINFSTDNIDIYTGEKIFINIKPENVFLIPQDMI
ncbi:MAG: ABC transporter ATP-binding protein [Thermoanaerobacteraceae bacterium]|nr:ABC transporter ATP-binding protein [Thermoanaerobacteraceae bacterium]